LARYPLPLVVIIAFDGFLVLMPWRFGNLSMYSIGGSLLLIGCVHSFLDDASIIVRKPMYPSLLFFTIGRFPLFDPPSTSRFDGRSRMQGPYGMPVPE
jgi:hypothetical protein